MHGCAHRASLGARIFADGRGASDVIDGRVRRAGSACVEQTLAAWRGKRHQQHNEWRHNNISIACSLRASCRACAAGLRAHAFCGTHAMCLRACFHCRLAACVMRFSVLLHFLLHTLPLHYAIFISNISVWRPLATSLFHRTYAATLRL